MSDISVLLNKLKVNHANSDIDICIETLKLLIDKILGTDQSYRYPKNFNSLLFLITKEESSIWQNSRNFKLAFLDYLLVCLQVSFCKTTEQLIICQNDQYIETLVSLLKHAMKEINDPSVEETATISKCDYMEDCRRIGSLCIKCLCNLMANNPENTKLLWLHLRILLQDVLNAFSCHKEGHYVSSLLHHFLLNAVIQKEIISIYDIPLMTRNLLILYMTDSQHSCFTLFCLEIILCNSSVLEIIWASLENKWRLLVLDILSSVVQKDRADQSNVPNSESIQMFMIEYKKAADQLLCAKNTHFINDPQVVSRILSFLSAAATTDDFVEMMQGDNSLLISSSYLLRAMNDSNSKKTLFSECVTGKDTREPVSVDSMYGFKCQLIRLIAALIYRNKVNQDTIRGCQILEELLENSQLDLENPLIKEICMYALRNACEGNLQNQEYLKTFEIKGVQQSSALANLGMSVTLQDGKPMLIPRNNSSIK